MQPVLLCSVLLWWYNQFQWISLTDLPNSGLFLWHWCDCPSAGEVIMEYMININHDQIITAGLNYMNNSCKAIEIHDSITQWKRLGCSNKIKREI